MAETTQELLRSLRLGLPCAFQDPSLTVPVEGTLYLSHSRLLLKDLGGFDGGSAPLKSLLVPRKAESRAAESSTEFPFQVVVFWAAQDGTADESLYPIKFYVETEDIREAVTEVLRERIERAKKSSGGILDLLLGCGGEAKAKGRRAAVAARASASAKMKDGSLRNMLLGCVGNGSKSGTNKRQFVRAGGEFSQSTSSRASPKTSDDPSLAVRPILKRMLVQNSSAAIDELSDLGSLHRAFYKSYREGMDEASFGWFLVQSQNESAEEAASVFRNWGDPYVHEKLTFEDESFSGNMKAAPVPKKSLSVLGLRRFLCDAEKNGIDSDADVEPLNLDLCFPSYLLSTAAINFCRDLEDIPTAVRLHRCLCFVAVNASSATNFKVRLGSAAFVSLEELLDAVLDAESKSENPFPLFLTLHTGRLETAEALLDQLSEDERVLVRLDPAATPNSVLSERKLPPERSSRSLGRRGSKSGRNGRSILKKIVVEATPSAGEEDPLQDEVLWRECCDWRKEKNDQDRAVSSQDKATLRHVTMLAPLLGEPKTFSSSQLATLPSASPAPVEAMDLWQRGFQRVAQSFWVCENALLGKYGMCQQMGVGPLKPWTVTLRPVLLERKFASHKTDALLKSFYGETKDVNIARKRTKPLLSEESPESQSSSRSTASGSEASGSDVDSRVAVAFHDVASRAETPQALSNDNECHAAAARAFNAKFSKRGIWIEASVQSFAQRSSSNRGFFPPQKAESGSDLFRAPNSLPWESPDETDRVGGASANGQGFRASLARAQPQQQQVQRLSLEAFGERLSLNCPHPEYGLLKLEVKWREPVSGRRLIIAHFCARVLELRAGLRWVEFRGNEALRGMLLEVEIDGG